MSNLPCTLDAKGLAALLHKSESTILRDVSRSPGSLPPFIKAGKKTIWLTQVVFDWLSGKSSEQVTIKIEIGSSTMVVGQKNRPPIMMPSLAEMMMSASKSKQA